MGRMNESCSVHLRYMTKPATTPIHDINLVPIIVCSNDYGNPRLILTFITAKLILDLCYYMGKYFFGKHNEYHNKIPQPILSTKRKSRNNKTSNR